LKDISAAVDGAADTLSTPTMTYIRHRLGGNDRDPSLEALRTLLRELDEDPADVEHESVSVVHDSDWALAAYVGGLVTLEHLEDPMVQPRHLRVENDSETLRLFSALAEGRLDEVFAKPWQLGYG
jgi:hypothetical protein